MQDKLKEAKRTLKKKELEAWIEAKKEAAKEGREKGPLIMKYVREFKVHGKDEVRRKRYQKYLLKTRREIAMTACAVAEPWYDREIWREYIRGGRADRLVRAREQSCTISAEYYGLKLMSCPYSHSCTAAQQELRIHTGRMAEQQSSRRD